MKPLFHSSFAAMGLFCALSGLTLAGCNRGGAQSSGTTTGVTGIASGASSDTLATVGTSKITRADLGTLLEAQSGQQALPLLIDTQLIFEALKAKSLEVSDAEVDAEFTHRQAKEPRLAAQVAAGGPLIPLLKVSLKREMAVQKLLTAGITPTDAQVKAFFAKNSRYYDQAPKATIAMLLTSTKTRADLMEQQLKKKTKTVAQLVAEQQKVADPVAGRSAENAAQSPIWSQISPGATQLTDKLAKGGITPVQQLAAQVFGIFVVTDKTAPVKADFAKIHADVEADYKSAQVAAKTAAKNPQNPKDFNQTLKLTYDSLKLGNPSTGAPPNPNVTLRDALNTINQYAANELIQGLRTGGTVQIEDPAYTKIATAYQPAGAAGTAGATGNAASGNAASGNAASGNSASGSAPTASAAAGNAAAGNTAAGNTAP